ncbi:crossover junction endodeoxyribonuclease RuvC [Patescibacteria group bacterium]
MIILGIDPGTASMGWGVIKIKPKETPILRDHGVVKTKPDLVMPKRLQVLYTGINDVAKEHSPDIFVIEKLFFNTNAKTAMTVGQARGVSMLVAAHNDTEVVEYTALQVKKSLAGYGRASKKEMQEAVKEILGLSMPIKPDDANDGIAMALHHHYLINE